MAGWVCVPLDIKWKQDELRERIEISNLDMIVTERYKVNDLPDEEGRVIEIDEWKRMIEKYLPTHSTVESLRNAPFIWDLHQDQLEKQKHFYVHSNRGFIVLIVMYMTFIYENGGFNFNSWDARSFSFLYGAISALYVGQTVHIMRKFIPNQVLDKLETENISVMYTVPTMLESLYKRK